MVVNQSLKRYKVLIDPLNKPVYYTSRNSGTLTTTADCMKCMSTFFSLVTPTIISAIHGRIDEVREKSVVTLLALAQQLALCN